MKKALLLITFFAFGFVTKAQEKINWLTFEEAIALNKTNPKPILISVYTDWCGWCKKMYLTTYSDKSVVEIINKNYHAVKLNGEEKKDITYKDYTFKFEDTGRRGYHQLAATLLNGKLSYPTTIFMTEKEQVIQNIPGFLEKDIFEKIVSYFSNDIYKTTKWEIFEKNYKSKP